MQIKTKYSEGDMVLVVTPKGEELVLQINKIITRTQDGNTCVEYYSKHYVQYEYDEYDYYTTQLPIVGSKEATKGCPIAYIKYEVVVMEVVRM